MAGKVSTVMVELDRLELGAFTPRISYDKRWILELAMDMERNGLLKPIICRKVDDRLQVVDGEYRVRAAKKLGWKRIRAEVRELSFEEALFLAMRINELHGKHLTSLEEGMHMLRLQKELGWTEEQIAEKYGRIWQWVSDRIMIAKNAHEETLKFHARGRISHTHTRELVELPRDLQPEAARKVAEEGLTTRETAFLVHALKKAGSEEEKRMVLEAPIKALTEVYEEEEKVVEAASSEKEELVETFECPRCGAKLVVDWVNRRVRWVEE